MINKPEIKKMLPSGEIKLAAVILAAGFLSLWASGHPVEEWSAVVVVFYVAFRLGLTAVMGLLACAAKLLAGYGQRVLQRHGVEVSGNDVAGSVYRRGRLWLIAVIVSTVAAVAAGAGIPASILAIGWLDITPLSPAFRLASWGLLGYGAAGLMLMLGAPALVFLVAHARIRVSDSRLTSAFSLLPEIQAGIPSARNK